jgi:alcohol dehydrogenase (cytochrome c)
MVAIDAATGKYRWHFQQIHHDLWDYDGPSPVVLFDVMINGRLRKAAAEPNKAGWVYIVDRTNGTPLIGIDEKPVPQEPRQATSRTQPIPRGDAFVPQSVDIAPEDYPLVNQGRIFTPFWKEAIVAKPGARGGANWPPSSYDPATSLLYVCATDAANLFRGGEDDQQITPEGQRYLGSAFGGAPIPASGIFAALDMKTNKLVWQQRWKDSCYSGSVTTAGGLVFTGRNDGRLTALNSSTGKRLWEFQTGAGMNSPVSVFEYEGDEYIVAYSAGSLFAGTMKGDSVWLLSVKGTMNEGEERSTR